MNELWTGPFLDEMREIGDPPVDFVVAKLVKLKDRNLTRAVNAYLQSYGSPFPKGAPEEIHHFMETSTVYPDWVDLDAVDRARAWFEVWGAFGILGMSVRALPQFLAAAKAAHVFASMESAVADSMYRLIVEIVNLIFQVMRPDGLQVDPDGPGVHALKKLRYHHAYVRCLVEQGTCDVPVWDPAWGVPMNQEDMALAVNDLVVYSFDALALIEVPFTDEIQEDVLMVFRIIGWLIGVREDMLPTDWDESLQYIAISGHRQYRRSKTGTALITGTIEALQRVLPDDLQNFPTAMMRYLMSPFFVKLLEVPSAAGVPKHVRSPQEVLDANPHLVQLLTGEALRELIEGFRTAKNRHGTREPFEVPETFIYSFRGRL